jgi:hypothetical protein
MTQVQVAILDIFQKNSVQVFLVESLNDCVRRV